MTLFAEFRSLGGIAENVRLGEGRLGRGVFAVDPALPAKLHCPENLLVPIEDAEIRDGQMVVASSSSLGAREREFFERYQRDFGWGAGLFDELREAQDQWSQLPAAVVECLRNLGAPEGLDLRFADPTVDVCLRQYVTTRSFNYHGGRYIVPVVEMTNHSSAAEPFVIGSGVGVAGTFAGEVLVRYNLDDTWKRAIAQGFSDPALLAYSLALTVDVGGQRVTVERDIAQFDLRDGIMFPRARVEGNAIHLPFLTLGFSPAPNLPRAVFRKIVSPALGTALADDVFDHIAHFNRTKVLNVLRVLKRHEGTVVRMLEEAAINQLEALSFCIGAKPL